MSSSADLVTGAAPGALRRRLRERFAAWLDRRVPPARSVTLDQRRLFIMPSRVGLLFFLCLLVMLLTAVNYQNNLGYGLTFLLVTLFVVAILHTYANLSGLRLHALRAGPAYPGQLTEFELRLERGSGRPRFGLHLGWPDGEEQVVSLVDQDSLDLRLHCPVGERGWFHPGRLRIESHYPLGLLRCWSWVDLDLRALVYPRPLAGKTPPLSGATSPGGRAHAGAGTDDFYGFRNYRPGDSLRQVHWKGFAKGQALQSKQYAAHDERECWLDWDALPGVSTEHRLSQLCFWALEFERRRRSYGLRLPGTRLSPGLGKRHLEQVLTVLALYGQERRQ
jgi:uncharacterized protein (DUF58 family)